MSNKRVIFLNSGVGIVSQIVSMIFQFVARMVFIKSIGIGLLGINSTFSSVLAAFSLAELGFQTAIVYSLYSPLNSNDKSEINKIVNVFKFVYRAIGIFFIVASIAFLPFIPKILTNVDINKYIYIFFLLQSSASVCSYFLAYKRTLLYADQKNYISQIIDLIANVVFNILQIISLAVFKNYLIYLVLKLLQVFISNMIVNIACIRIYPYLHSEKIDKSILQGIWSNVKNVFVGKVAGYIYTSTDNLVISTVVSTVSVGYLVNYTTITYNLKAITNSILNPIAPIIGNHLTSENSKNDKEHIFSVYTHVRFIIAIMLIVPTTVLIDDFVSMWVGRIYIMPKIIVILLVADLFIHLVHSACCDYINGMGLFKHDRNIAIVGAAVNIIVSIILAKLIGIEGVLIGTVVSQIIFWIGRSIIVYKACFNLELKRFNRYWIKNIVYIVATAFMILASKFIYSLINIKQPVFKFILGGIITECIVGVVYVCIFRSFNESREVIAIIKKNIIRKKLKVAA
ncbi:polysaccharide biosynthesis C-terminal domain-containing protein [Clostridium manihotivorum]|nr:oligosaccharide flippase family protein [Clostridium manihotivorum]